MSDFSSDSDDGAFDLTKLAPELHVKVFEALPDLWTAVALRLTCRDLNVLFLTYRAQIEVAIRDNPVAPFYEYYHFLGRLHIPESAIRHPPPGGWPNITRETCTEFGKTDFVVDVLRHLPFIAEDGRQNFHNIDYKSNAVDYSTATRETFADEEIQSGLILTYGTQGPVVEHTLVIAIGYESGGVELYFDTRSGVMYEEIVRVGGDVHLPVREYFEMKMDQCRELQQVFVPGEDPAWGGFGEEVGPYDAAAMEESGEPSLPDELFDMGSDEDLEWVRHLYRKFGWPGEDWRKEEGLKAITEYAERRHTETDIKRAQVDRIRAQTERRTAEAHR